VRKVLHLYYVIKMITNKQKTKVMKNEMELVLEMLEKRFKQHSDAIDVLTQKIEDGSDEVDDHDEMIYSEAAYQEVESIINFIKTLNK